MSIWSKLGLGGATRAPARPSGANRIIQGLWIGRPLSLNEKLSITSFLDHGHEYHLYLYDDVGGIPPGTIVKDATEILPRERIFQFHTGSYAMFADNFRIHLLRQRGGWWCDLDMVCLKPFDLPDDHVLITEPDEFYRERALTNGIMKLPPHTEFSARCLAFLDAVDNATNRTWTLTNRNMLEKVVAELQAQRYVKPPELFSPLFWGEATPTFTDPRYARKGLRIMRRGRAYTLHLFNEFWRKNGLDPNARYHPKSLVEILRRRHGI
ncbi:MAG: hypothetical protein IT440_16060 [Phycisphaeraceae bacterium]|nr:hypothetical protein [Phycisphaeraceae bacterium]